MKHKKILLTLLIFTLLVITLSLTALAMPNFGDYNGEYNQVASQLTLTNNYLELSWLHMAETSFRNDSNQIIFILFFTVDVNSLSQELLNSDFVNSGQSAVDFLNFMSLGSINAFYSSSTWYTNLDAVIGQINAIGETILLNSSNEILRSENETLIETNSELEDENFLLNAQLTSLNEGFYMLQQNYNTLADENVILKQTVEDLKSSSGDGYTAAIDVMRMWFNDRGYSYELSDSSVASVIFRNELETNILALKQAAFMEGETAGLNSGEIAKDSILSIFSAPFYFLSNVLNFEILGINLYSIISFLITTAVVVFFFKKIKG